jgi:hypothetical protein
MAGGRAMSDGQAQPRIPGRGGVAIGRRCAGAGKSDLGELLADLARRHSSQLRHHVPTESIKTEGESVASTPPGREDAELHQVGQHSRALSSTLRLPGACPRPIRPSQRHHRPPPPARRCANLNHCPHSGRQAARGNDCERPVDAGAIPADRIIRRCATEAHLPFRLRQRQIETLHLRRIPLGQQRPVPGAHGRRAQTTAMRRRDQALGLDIEIHTCALPHCSAPSWGDCNCRLTRWQHQKPILNLRSRMSQCYAYS